MHHASGTIRQIVLPGHGSATCLTIAARKCWKILSGSINQIKYLTSLLKVENQFGLKFTRSVAFYDRMPSPLTHLTLCGCLPLASVEEGSFNERAIRMLPRWSIRLSASFLPAGKAPGKEVM